MASPQNRPLIGWTILVYDKTATTRFPFKPQHYKFNYSRASESAVQSVLALIGYAPIDYDSIREAVETETVIFEIGGSRDTSKEILKYRHLFDRVDSIFRDESEMTSGVRWVTLPHESYFEDETGVAMSLVEIMDYEAKLKRGPNAQALVLDQPETILRRGPAQPMRAELWSATDATLIAQLCHVCDLLMGSRWIRSPCTVATGKNTVSAILPIHEDCMAVVLPFRQLQSKDGADDLFNRCCKLHNRHVDLSHPSHMWVDHYRRRFNKALDDTIGVPIKTTISCKRYLEAFFYGASLVHASAKDDTPASDLASLIEANGRELVVMGYHQILRILLSSVSMALPVVRQNLRYWIGDLAWQGPQGITADVLFGSSP